MWLPEKADSKPSSGLFSLAVQGFAPNWFAITMGTGVMAQLLAELGSSHPLFFTLATALWLANIGLFVLFSLLYLIHCWRFPIQARQLLSHPQMSLFLSTIPMGLATIINGCLLFGLPLWGETALSWATHLWFFDTFLAVLCGVALPLLMFIRQSHHLDGMSGLWLLPVVAAEVAAASGWSLAPHLLDRQLQQQIVIYSMLLWACSVPVAFCILTILLLRLALHKLPPASMAASIWLAVGPIGTGALGMLLLSSDSMTVMQHGQFAHYSNAVAAIGWLLGIVLWGAGSWWLLIALGTTFYYLKRGIPFNLGWWAYVFPLGVFTLATFKLAAMIAIPFFSAIATLLLGLLSVIWLTVMLKTLSAAWSGRFYILSASLENKTAD